MMRCPDCQKFVSFDVDTDPELDLSVDDEGLVTGTVRIMNACADCGQELTEASLDVEIDLTEEVQAHRAEHREARLAALREEHPDDPHVTVSDDDNEGHDSLDLESEEATRNDRTQTTDRHGRPIKSARYMRTFYGAEVNVTVKCTCGEEFTGTFSDEVQASGMDSLV